MIRMLLPFVFIGVLVWSSTVQAEPGPSAAQQQQAKRYVNDGIKAQQAGDYDAAIAQFQKAYQLVPHPVLIFDMAQTYRMGGKLEQALRLYRQYLAKAPDGDQAPLVRDLIAELEAKLSRSAQTSPARAGSGAQGTGSPAGEAAAANGPAPVQPAERAGGVVDVAGSTDAGSGANKPDGALMSPAGEPALQTRRDAGEPAAREAPAGRTLRIAGLATSGAGIAALAVGTGFALHARSLSLQPGDVWDPDKDAAGRRADKIAIAGFVAGGALIATGAVLYWRGHAQERGFRKAIIVPAASDRSIGLVLTGQWP